MKTCNSCGKIKPVADFPPGKRYADGIRPRCRECINAYQKRRRAKHREYINAQAMAYYWADPEKHRARARADIEKNRERRAKRRAADPDSFYRSNRNWKRKNKIKVKAAHANRKAKIKKIGGQITAADIRAVLKKQKGRCPVCFQKIGKKYHVDHVLPLALGGSNTSSNIQITHDICNLQKGAKHPIEFAQQLGRLL